MNDHLLLVSILFLIGLSFAISFFMQKKLIKISQSQHFFDDHDEKRKVRKRARIGGIGIFFAYFSSVYLFLLIYGFFTGMKPLHLSDLRIDNIFLYIGAIFFIFSLGVLDDFSEQSAKTKLIIQFLVAGILYSIGFKIRVLSVPFGEGFIYLGYLSIPFTIFWIVGIINSINLIDGIDGLAGGIIVLSSLATSIILLMEKEYGFVLLLIPLMGAFLGFLPFNRYPAKIFMGDSGSLFAGAILSTLIIKTSYKAIFGVTLIIPIALLIIPILDVSIAVLRRILAGKSPFIKDREHIHHRLLKKGLSEKKVCDNLLIISALSSFFGILFYSAPPRTRSFMFLFFFASIIVLLFFFGYLKLNFLKHHVPSIPVKNQLFKLLGFKSTIKSEKSDT
jgi:UDP-GlcNAc:undecaprenyl-phosphate GlcNAc-1-phosphate transferase